MSSEYERELKGILEADPAALARVERTSGLLASEAYRRAALRPFLVVRAAGSLGVDLVALRGDVSFPIEVKSSVEKTINFSSQSGKNARQADAMREACARAGVLPIYAFRLKRVRDDDPWRVFALPTEGLSGRPGHVYESTPKIPLTRNGKLALKWDDGLPLHKFLDRLAQGGTSAAARAVPTPTPLVAPPLAITTD